MLGHIEEFDISKLKEWMVLGWCAWTINGSSLMDRPAQASENRKQRGTKTKKLKTLQYTGGTVY
ncbi:hypothetical protein T12_12381 [Trichinella patagoniensis]|uniref:Uncharacterized protein n=1 Tax=Trichinella patagoniensis TaxID=990121 RepID=A0A0V0ZQB7_9BILA|nr:hypothetical protein T12_12381 [Trichinella patagoniensis]